MKSARRARRLGPLALAGALAAPLPAAADSPAAAGAEPPSTVTELSSSRLPYVAAIPSIGAAEIPPAEGWVSSLDGLRVIPLDNTGVVFDRDRPPAKGRRFSGSVTLQAEHVGLLVGLTDVPNPNPSTSISLMCDVPDHPAGTEPRRLRWESLTADGGGAPLWQRSVGWFDPHRCLIVAVRHAEVRPTAVAATGEHSFVFAARGDDALWVFAPAATSVVADAADGFERRDSPMMHRLWLPMHKGAGGSAALVVNAAAYESWARHPGRAASAVVASAVDFAVSVDVSQAVSEARPTIIVTKTPAIVTQNTAVDDQIGDR